MRFYLVAFAFVAFIAFSSVESRPKGERVEGGELKNQDDGNTAAEFTSGAPSTEELTETTSGDSTSVSTEAPTSGDDSENTTTKGGDNSTSSSSPAPETSSTSDPTPGSSTTSGSEPPVTKSTDETTEAPFTSTKAVPTPEPTAAPSHRSGSSFDGWSFFGGILLTVGISTVSLVGYKYYKARTGSGSMNYNRADDI